MSTTTLSKHEIRVNELTAFANELKANGFTVLVSAKHPFEWLYFEKNGRFGTAQPANFYGYNFGTTHKPCREYGTGFGTIQEAELTIENANNALSRPVEFSYAKGINYYTSVNDFITSTNNKWAEFYAL